MKVRLYARVTAAFQTEPPDTTGAMPESVMFAHPVQEQMSH